MKKYCGGKLVTQGTYLSLSTGEIIQMHGESLVLPGTSEVQYLEVPGQLVMAAGPLAGLAFIIFLPPGRHHRGSRHACLQAGVGGMVSDTVCT